MPSSQPSSGSGQSGLGPPFTAPQMIEMQSSLPMTVVLDADTADAALSAHNMEATPPVSGAGSVVIPCRGLSRARITFAGTDAANEDGTYQVHLWFEARNRAASMANEGVAYWAEKQAAGAMTLGAKTYGASGTGLGASGNLIADTITDTVSKAGTVVVSPADDTQAYLDIALDNATFIEIETKRGNMATVDVLVQLG